MGTGKKIVIIVILALIAGAVWYWWKKKKEAEVLSKKADPSGLTTPSTPVATIFPLKLGSSGKEVRQLQTWLYKQNGGDISKLLGPDGIDGKFGPFTESATNKTIGSSSVNESLFKTKGIDKISA